MLTPSTPADESARIAALQFLDILDTESEERFDRITALAKELLGTPICLVSLVDTNRQWFKSRQGLDATETPRDISFCGHAILQPETFVVEDASVDERFSDNPLVTGEPSIRFYAGHPLRADGGYRIGTLCVIDREPRVLDENQLSMIRHLAGLVESEFRSRSEIRGYVAELATANHKILEAAEAKAQFVANMSHEIRTPMASLMGYVDLIDDPATSVEDRKDYCAILRSSGEHLLALVSDILDLAKVQAGRMEVLRTPTPLSKPIIDVLRLMEIPARQKGIELEASVDGSVPEQIEVDPVRLRQILVNLVGNAIKFTSSGSISIRVRMQSAGSQLEIEVQDSGVGMTEAQLERVFEPFRQATTDTDRYFGGTGLGLTISQHLAVALGGGITVQSEEGRGSTFVLRIDPGNLEGVKLIESLVEFDSHEPVAEVEVLEGRVLVAEDNKVNRLLLEKILVRYGLEVSLVEHGRAAVSAARAAEATSLPYDLILMDMVMPLVDGYSATSELRSAGYRAPIVALTGHVQSSDRDRCLSAGCDEVLSKPIDRVALVQVLARYLGNRSAIPSIG